MSQSAQDTTSALSAIPNPFARDVVGSALDETKADVPRINKAPFDHCLKLIERVRTRRESGSLLLYGEPGAGKTHLLSRLRAQLAGTDAVLVPLRMQTSPGMIWRFVRGHLADALLRRKTEQSSTLEHLLRDRRHEVDALPYRDLAIVLEHLIEGRHVRDAGSWLHGRDLPEPALVEMNLSTLPVDEESQEDRAQQVIRSIAHLAEPVPLVFCLDQVEALQRHINDQEGIFALGKLVSTLHDTLRNAAIVCCMQTSFIDSIRAAIRDSDQDRMLRNKAELLPLKFREALDLIDARLATEPEIAEVRPRGAGRLWPIDPEKLKPVFAPGDACVARKVLHRCRELYEEAARGADALPEPLDAYLGRLYQDRYRIRPPQESDFILRDALPQLLEILGLQPRGFGAAPNAGGYDVVIEHEGRPAAFALCNQRPGLGLVNRFRKLGEKWDIKFTPRLILLRDARLGIGPNARSSHQRLEELRERRAELITVSPEALAALDALRSLLADADAGDLSHNGESVSRKKVEEWIANHLPDPVADLVDRLRNSGGASSPLTPLLTDLLNDRKIVSMEEAARDLKVGLKEVAECARQDPQQFAVIDGHSPVLFQPVRPSAG